jgi:hypothetical protein
MKAAREGWLGGRAWPGRDGSAATREGWRAGGLG